MRRKPFKEGDWFAVPIPAGYVLGRIVRVGRRGGILLGYFFEPVFDELPALSAISHLQPEQAFYIRQFCDPGLIDDGWPIIPSQEAWKRGDWPMPLFGRRGKSQTGYARSARYDENDLSICVGEWPITAEEALKLPQEGLSGHRALQGNLEKYFSEGKKVYNLDDPDLALIWYQGLPSTELP